MSDYLERFGLQPGYPSQHHAAAAASATAYWAGISDVEAVLLTCSCARNQAAPSSCVDLAVLVPPAEERRFRDREMDRFAAFAERDAAIQALSKVARWSAVDLEIIIGEFPVPYHGYTSGPDDYEVAIGNYLAWSIPLYTQGGRLGELRKRWLPYYSEELARKREAMVLGYAHNNVDHIEPFAQRGLVFQARKRLQHAAEEYLQALFIQRRIYPIAYDKWVTYQLVDVLRMPQTLHTLQQALGVALKATSLTRAATLVRGLLDRLGPRPSLPEQG